MLLLSHQVANLELIFASYHLYLLSLHIEIEYISNPFVAIKNMLYYGDFFPSRCRFHP